jgi:hypothetical protein
MESFIMLPMTWKAAAETTPRDLASSLMLQKGLPAGVKTSYIWTTSIIWNVTVLEHAHKELGDPDSPTISLSLRNNANTQ